MTYRAVLYASALEPVDAPRDDVQTGDLDRPRRATVSDVEAERRVYAHTSVRSDSYDAAPFSTQEEFRAFLRENTETGDLGEVQVRKITTIEA